LKIVPHLERKHGCEKEVKDFVKQTDPKKRKAAIMKIRSRGNFAHNIEVLKRGEGCLLVSRRPSRKGKKASQFVPCIHCLNFFYSKDLHRHKCKLGDGAKGVNLVATGRVVLMGFVAEVSRSATRILGGMKSAEMATLIRSDWLLLQYCETLCHTYSTSKGLNNHIREKTRQMGKLYAELKSGLQDQDVPFSSFFTGASFDRVIEAVHTITGSGDKVTGPSLALKLGHGLKKCASIIIGRGLRENNEVTIKDVSNFLTLMENEWSTQVSRHALQNLTRMKHTK
jgi:hypothetical protein